MHYNILLLHLKLIFLTNKNILSQMIKAIDSFMNTIKYKDFTLSITSTY